MQSATRFHDRNAALLDAFMTMAEGTTRPAEHRWRFDDAKKGRPVKVMGCFPEVVDSVIDAGGSYSAVEKPLRVMMAHVRRRCRNKLASDYREAIVAAKRESDEAEAAALQWVMSPDCPKALNVVDRETSEALLALDKVREIVADRVLELQDSRSAR